MTASRYLLAIRPLYVISQIGQDLEPLLSGLDVLQTYLTPRDALAILAFDHDLPELLDLSPMKMLRSTKSA